MEMGKGGVCGGGGDSSGTFCATFATREGVGGVGQKQGGMREMQTVRRRVFRKKTE